MRRNAAKELVLLLLLALAAACTTATSGLARAEETSPATRYAPTVERAEDRVSRMMKRYHLPSAAVALIDDQDTVWLRPFGWSNVEDQIPATPDTVYKMWSVAKVFTAMETMRLVEEGLIDLDAPISDYLPGFSIQSRFTDAPSITVRSILSHHAGLPRNGCHMITDPPGSPNALRAIAESVVDCQQAYTTLERYKYSNLGPNILGHLIEKFRGRSFAEHMKEQLLDPIGMTSSAFLLADLPESSEVALGYEYWKRQYYPSAQADINTLPCGNLYSTLGDMVAFAKFILRGGDASDQQLIGQDTLQLMFQNQYASAQDPQPMGLGWKLATVLGSERMVWHDGGPEDGIAALIALLPERKLGVLLMANGQTFEGSVSLPLAVELLGDMLQAQTGLAVPAEPPPKRVEVDRDMLTGYTGRYLALGDVGDVSLRGAQLQLKIYGLKLNLVPMADGTFRLRHWLLDLGLQKLLKLPMDLRDLEIEFRPETETGDGLMVIDFDGLYFEMCPKYPEASEISPLWQALTGQYQLRGRLGLRRAGNDVIGTDEIRLENGILTMGGVIGPLKPLSEREVVILSGPFAGELIVREPDAGRLYHQWVVYSPVELEPGATLQ